MSGVGHQGEDCTDVGRRGRDELEEQGEEGEVSAVADVNGLVYGRRV